MITANTLTLHRMDERYDIRINFGDLVGYYEDGKVCGIDRNGYAVEVGQCGSPREAVQMLREWWNNKR